jgi:hypothetical protein
MMTWYQNGDVVPWRARSFRPSSASAVPTHGYDCKNSIHKHTLAFGEGEEEKN